MTKRRNPQATAAWQRKAGGHEKGSKRPEPEVDLEQLLCENCGRELGYSCPTDECAACDLGFTDLRLEWRG